MSMPNSKENEIHLTVATLVKRNGRYLIVEEMDGNAHVFNNPAGHVEPGEHVIAAAQRETLEETGWEVKVTAFIGLFHYHSARNGVTYYRLAFAAETIEQVYSGPIDKDILACHWLTIDEIEQLGDRLRSHLVLGNIRLAEQGKTYPLAIIDAKG